MSHSDSSNEASRPQEGIIDRIMHFCPWFDEMDTRQRFQWCEECRRYYIRCCQHPEQVCHHFELVFVDGACINNGNIGAVAGLGVAIGQEEDGSEDDEGSEDNASSEDDEDSQEEKAPQQLTLSIAVDDEVDNFPKRSSQRAELLAAIEGIRFLCSQPKEKQHVPDHVTGLARLRSNLYRDLVVATDSKYVFDGITSWVSAWKANNWRTAAGTVPSNLDLFIKLDALISKLLREKKTRVGFWHIDRSDNGVADWLAKHAAREAAEAELYAA